MGDLSEPMASIAEKGVIEPLIVRQRGGRFQIVAGERRYQAAVQVGLREIPVVVRDADDHEAIELALVENLQRKDLTPFEEADALHALGQRCGYTHEELARKLGKSRTAVTEALALVKLPEEVRNLCRLADISSKSLLLEIVRQNDVAKMMALVERITSQQNATREVVRRERAKTKPGRPRAFVFQYRPATKAFNLRLVPQTAGRTREVIEAPRQSSPNSGTCKAVALRLGALRISRSPAVGRAGRRGAVTCRTRGAARAKCRAREWCWQSRRGEGARQWREAPEQLISSRS
jgi:ParB family chromosome partitioning protein